MKAFCFVFLVLSAVAIGSLAAGGMSEAVAGCPAYDPNCEGN